MQWFPRVGLWGRNMKTIRPHNPTIHCNPHGMAQLILVFIKYGIGMIAIIIFHHRHFLSLKISIPAPQMMSFGTFQVETGEFKGESQMNGNKIQHFLIQSCLKTFNISSWKLILMKQYLRHYRISSQKLTKEKVH